MFLGCFYIHHVTSILPELLNATSVNVKIECGQIILINPLLFASITFSVYAQRVKSPHTQQELFLEEMVHEGFAGNELSDIKKNKSAVLSSWKTPLGLFILLISDTRGTMAVIKAYLQSPLTKPRAFGPEAEPKAIYCPRTREHVVDVVVFVYHYNEDDATSSGLCCCFKHTPRFNRGPRVSKSCHG